MNKKTAIGKLTEAEVFFLGNLEYNSETGVLRWINKTSRNTNAGDVAGCIRSNGYRVVSARSVQFKAHRVAWFLHFGFWPNHHIDHINGVRDDNRIANLRDVPPSINVQNLHAASKNSKSGLLGVFPSGNRWVASISTDRKRRHLGCFATPHEAHQAYLDEKRRAHIGCEI